MIASPQKSASNLKSARLPTTGYTRALKIMFIWRELGGTGTVCLFQFTNCVYITNNVNSNIQLCNTCNYVKNSKYDQEIPQSQTADNPVAPRGRAAQPSRDTRKTN